ncbi:MAG: hypothetical protein QF464_14325, partial [Myxococcota bacterium]|nr:hypothetical protein [Myxococcota bacterium]
TPVLFPGIGEASRADVTVTWPSGLVQTALGLDQGRLHVLTEPAVLSVEPSGRHVTIGEGAVATLTVRPHRPTTSVTAHITHGDGIPGTATEVQSGVWHVQITPPPTSGSARIEVRLDGEPVGIRPRIWWD